MASKDFTHHVLPIMFVGVALVLGLLSVVFPVVVCCTLCGCCPLIDRHRKRSQYQEMYPHAGVSSLPNA